MAKGVTIGKHILNLIEQLLKRKVVSPFLLFHYIDDVLSLNKRVILLIASIPLSLK